MLVGKRNEAGVFNLGNSRGYPVNAYIPTDPLIDGKTYRRLSGAAAKLANDREQLDIADLGRKWCCVRQSHAPCGMRSAPLGGATASYIAGAESVTSPNAIVISS